MEHKKETVEDAANSYAKGWYLDDEESRLAAVLAFKAGTLWKREQSPWIEPWKFPPIDKPILLRYGDTCIDDMDIGYYTGLHYLNKEGQQVDVYVTYWMPIPE